MVSLSVAKAAGAGTSELLFACVAEQGSAGHPYFASDAFAAGTDSARNLADAVHFLCALHGRHPGIVDLAAGRTPEADARAWLNAAGNAMAAERLYLTQLAVAAAGSVTVGDKPNFWAAPFERLRDAMERVAADLDMQVEVERGTGDNRRRPEGRSHVTVLGTPLKSPAVAAITYGPVVLSGNYGNTALSRLPVLDTTSITRTSGLAFTARADGATVNLVPFYDAHGFNYTVYWSTSGGSGGGTAAGYRLVNAGSGLVLGVQDMSTADGGLAVQWNDTGTADHNWELVPDGSAVRLRNLNSGKVLGVENMSTADNARVLQWSNTGTADHKWTVLDNGDGTHKLRNGNSGKMLGILNGSTAAGGQAVQDPDNGTADNPGLGEIVFAGRPHSCSTSARCWSSAISRCAASMVAMPPTSRPPIALGWPVSENGPAPGFPIWPVARCRWISARFLSVPCTDWFKPMQYSDSAAGLRPNHSAAWIRSATGMPHRSAAMRGV